MENKPNQGIKLKVTISDKNSELMARLDEMMNEKYKSTSQKLPNENKGCSNYRR